MCAEEEGEATRSLGCPQTERKTSRSSSRAGSGRRTNGQLRKELREPSQFAMTSLAGKENVRADVVGAAASHLEALFASHAVDASHGILHARAVLAHADAALAAAARPLPAERALAVRLAALLHDADDKKYWQGERGVARQRNGEILGAVERGARGRRRRRADDPLGVGFDELTRAGARRRSRAAAGAVGRPPSRKAASRRSPATTCNLAAGDPLCVPAATPRPRTEGEALALATEERFAAYQASGGGSASA